MKSFSESWSWSALFALLVALTLSLGPGRPVSAKVLLSVQEALQGAFPDSSIERVTFHLTEDQKEEVEKVSGSELSSSIARPARAFQNGKLVGTAYFDTHRVRTLAETLMIVVSLEGTVQSLQVLSFKEPLEYIPGDPWYRQFLQQGLDRNLALGQDIHGVTGATLTARATTDAVRRVLALHQVLQQHEEEVAQLPAS